MGVKRGDIVARGDQVDADPIAAGYTERVRVIDDYDNSFFSWADTFVLMTE